mmetsp:Transcript_50632/g.134852  ORF Transcript_50632/g.134852 Transcript_50632/m.134852 type:complete len:116 (+) Transcript_50632:78-425(+)
MLRLPRTRLQLAGEEASNGNSAVILPEVPSELMNVGTTSSPSFGVAMLKTCTLPRRPLWSRAPRVGRVHSLACLHIVAPGLETLCVGITLISMTVVATVLFLLSLFQASTPQFGA